MLYLGKLYYHRASASRSCVRGRAVHTQPGADPAARNVMGVLRGIGRQTGERRDRPLPVVHRSSSAMDHVTVRA